MNGLSRLLLFYFQKRLFTVSELMTLNRLNIFIKSCTKYFVARRTTDIYRTKRIFFRRFFFIEISTCKVNLLRGAIFSFWQEFSPKKKHFFFWFFFFWASIFFQTAEKLTLACPRKFSMRGRFLRYDVVFKTSNNSKKANWLLRYPKFHIRYDLKLCQNE